MMRQTRQKTTSPLEPPSDGINQLLDSTQERGGASRLAEGSSPEQGSRCTPTTLPFRVAAKRLTHPRKNPVHENIREGGTL